MEQRIVRPRIVLAIVGKELKEAVRNRTLLLVVLLPLLASLGFAWLERAGTPALDVGVPAQDLPFLAERLPLNGLRLHPYQGAGTKDLFEVNPHWDALISLPRRETGEPPADGAAPRLPSLAALLSRGSPVQVTLHVNPRAGTAARAAAAQLPILLSTLGPQPPLVQVRVDGAGEGLVTGDLLALWMTVTSVMLGIMIMSGNVAEERDKGTLLAVLTTPARVGELMAAKALYGTLLVVAASVIMLAVHGVPVALILSALLPLVPGAAGLTILGLFLGFVAPNQATARSYGTLVYLPLLIPVFASDASAALARWAGLFPSHHLWAGLKASLQGGYDAWPAWAGQEHALWLAGFTIAAGVLLSVLVGLRRF